MTLTPLAFSRDRPAQLDLLLRSVERNGGKLLGPSVVLFRSTSPDYDRGYETCIGEHPDVRFVEEHDFQAQVRCVVEDTDASRHVVFLTDDDVLYRDVASFGTDPLRLLDDDASVLCFSLRLGLNTQVVYPLNRRQPLPPVGPLVHALRWQWRDGDGDFAYPYSLDGHILRAGDVADALAGHSYTNPNTLEDALVAGLRDSPRPRMASFFLSALVGVPLNRTAETHGGNRVSSLPGCSPRELNDRYLAGERLSLATVDAWKVDGAHSEFAPVWEAAEVSAQMLEKKLGQVGAVSE